MPRPFRRLGRVETDEGPLELLERGPDDYLITVGGRVLMNSRLHLSEVALSEIACGALREHPRARALISGLGMGYSLRAALDVLPPDAEVHVVELHQAVVDWCRGPIAALSRGALDDPRVRVVIGDVAKVISESNAASSHFDAIVLDLYQGPLEASRAERDPFFGTAALRRARAALREGGLFAVWSEDTDRAFEKRLENAGFSVERRRPGKGGPRHAVYLARRA